MARHSHHVSPAPGGYCAACGNEWRLVMCPTCGVFCLIADHPECPDVPNYFGRLTRNENQ